MIDIWDAPNSSLPSMLGLQIANGCVVALNALNANLNLDRLASPARKSPNAAQRSVHCHVMEQVSRFISRLDAFPEHLRNWRGSLARHTEASSTQFVKLRAEAVDRPSLASTATQPHWSMRPSISAYLTQPLFSQSSKLPGTRMPRYGPMTFMSTQN